MEEILLFILSIFFGAFFFILILICCLRGLAFLRNDDTKHLCFKRKQADLRRRRIQLSLLPEAVLHRPQNLGYVAAPDENIDQYTICQPYVYEDGRSTGMRMIANLPIAIAFTSQSGIPTDAIFTSIFPPGSLSPHTLPLHNNPEVMGDPHFMQNCQNLQNYQNLQHLQALQNLQNIQIQMEDPPPPGYLEAQMQNFNEKGEEDYIEEQDELPPPSYDECMQIPLDNPLLYI